MGREWLVLWDKEKARDQSEWRLADSKSVIWHCVIIITVVIIIIVLRANLTLALHKESLSR